RISPAIDAGQREIRRRLADRQCLRVGRPTTWRKEYGDQTNKHPPAASADAPDHGELPPGDEQSQMSITILVDPPRALRGAMAGRSRSRYNRFSGTSAAGQDSASEV